MAPRPTSSANARRWVRFAMSSLAALALFHTTALAEVRRMKVNLKYVYYDIQGNTARELYDQMNRRGPMAQGGRAIAVAIADYEWAAKCICKGSSCRMKVTAFVLNETIVLPRWKPPRGTSPRLVSSWGQFSTMVKKHELTHRDIDVRVGKDLLRQLKLMKPKSSCTRIQSAVTKLEKRKLSERLGSNHERFHRDFYTNAARNPIQLVD